MNTNLFITCLVTSQAQTLNIFAGDGLYSLDTKIHAVARNRSSTQC